MAFKRLLIANRGEIAVRIARSAQELGIATVAVFSEDDAGAMHTRMADDAIALGRSGPAAYLDGEELVRAAQRAGCDALHPGYGFLSENARFAQQCRAAGIAFVGPSEDVLNLFGDKARARRFAAEHGVPVPSGTRGATVLDEARTFMQGLPMGSAVMVKALSGGGGRGMRRVAEVAALEAAFAACASEAAKAFGDDDLYVEQVVPDARHIEVQILGDGRHAVTLGDRDCSVQRRHQKLVEIAPSPWLEARTRDELAQAALTLAQASHYATVGTFEFLVPTAPAPGVPRFYFIEANPRIQVEHTVTEEVTGIDLVATQIRLAAGETLADIGLGAEAPRLYPGYAIQLRVLMEAMGATRGGTSGNVLSVFDAPSGPGVRVDTHCSVGYAPSRNFDSLLAKLIVTSRSNDFAQAVDRAYRALSEFTIDGVDHNLQFLRNLLVLPDLRAGPTTTGFVEAHAAELARSDRDHVVRCKVGAPPPRTMAEARPLGLQPAVPDGHFPVMAEMSADVAAINVVVGQRVERGQQLALLEAMKMEHALSAPRAGWVRRAFCQRGQHVERGVHVFWLEPDDDNSPAAEAEASTHTHGPRVDLEDVRARHRLTLDEARPDAVARRRATRQRTARENLDDLCDPGSLREYGALAVAAQRSSRSFEELQRISPADGFIYGLCSINAAQFGPDRARCFVGAADYTVFSGTQGFIGHKKLDRLFELTEQHRLPLVLFTEGGGGRALDTDNFAGVNLANPTFWKLGRLSGLVPMVGIVSGPCFAASAALLGCCDVTIATRDASIGMGGPVMIEGAGLGRYATAEVGPAPMHAKQGVVDVLVADEAEAVAVAKRYVGFFQGTLGEWSVADQVPLREAIPERRTRAYSVREVIGRLVDNDSSLELRAEFGCGIVTTLARIEGRTVGIVANDSRTNGGAIGADEADKLTRFMKLCSTFGVPIVSLCDTPGFMVGPEAEKTALVRHVSRIFLAGPRLRVPFFTVVLRKAYGLGGMAMGGGCFAGSLFAIAWPTGEFGSMGLEGQARLAHRRELEAIADPNARAAQLKQHVDRLYERNKAANIATYLSIDDVIDPAHTRQWLVDGLRSARTREPDDGDARHLDAW